MNNNLKPFNTLTEEEQRKIASNGGKASGEARRKKKAMKELVNEMLALTLKAGEAEEITSLADINGKNFNGKNLTVEQAMIAAQMAKALKGDSTAFQVLRDTSGNKPSDRVDLTGAMPVVIKDDVTE